MNMKLLAIVKVGNILIKGTYKITNTLNYIYFHYSDNTMKIKSRHLRLIVVGLDFVKNWI